MAINEGAIQELSKFGERIIDGDGRSLVGGTRIVGSNRRGEG